MFCARTNANIAQADCHTIILGTTDNAKFTVCRSACLYGIGLAQSVRHNNYAQPGPAAGLMEATMPNTTPNATPDAPPGTKQNAYPHGITLSELSALAGVKYSTAWAIVKDKRGGKTPTSPASNALADKLAELGLTLHDITSADRKADKKAAAEKLKPVTPSAPKPEAKPVLRPPLNNNPLQNFAETFQAEGTASTQAAQEARKAVERVLSAGLPEHTGNVSYFGFDMAKGYNSVNLQQYLDSMPLEEVIAAIHRRMPGAVVVCKAG